ncbi:MAG: ABC transporter permease, partial [Actinobacteria bacterium]
MRRPRWLIPWLLMAPGLLWLLVFFVLPNIQMVTMSLSSGTLGQGYTFSWDFDNYLGALGRFPDNFRNSIVYGGLATLLCFLIGYPLAYGIAFRGGRYKNILLFLVIAPFFTSFLIRVISWRIILGDQGVFLAMIRDFFGIVPGNFSVIGTPLAV